MAQVWGGGQHQQVLPQYDHSINVADHQQQPWNNNAAVQQIHDGIGVHPQAVQAGATTVGYAPGAPLPVGTAVMPPPGPTPPVAAPVAPAAAPPIVPPAPFGGPSAAEAGKAGAASAGAQKSVLAVLVLVLVMTSLATIGLAVALGIIHQRYRNKDNEIADAVAAANAARTCNNDNPSFLAYPPRVADVFDPFSPDELTAVVKFLKTKFNLQDAENDNVVGNDWLYLVDRYPADKLSELNYLDNATPSTYPGRYARAVIYRMADPNTARVEEYKVGPISSFSPVPANTPAVLIDFGGNIGTQIPFLMRPVTGLERDTNFEPLVSGAMDKLYPMILESYGEGYNNSRMYWTDSAPRNYIRAKRQTWIWLVWYAVGMYQLPLGMEMLVDHTSLDMSQWKVIQIVYNDQPFSTPEALLAAYRAGTVTKLVYPFPATDDWKNSPLWSSMVRRGAERTLANLSVPLTAPQGGHRFGVKGRQISWLGWDVHLGYTVCGGTVYNDIRFKGQRIVYELALQDAFAGYSGFNVIQALSVYSDAGWGLGYSDFPLIPGVDCPPWAVYIDTAAYVEGELKLRPRAVCVWEQPDNIALMRHFDQDFLNGGYTFAAGYPRTSLVVRTTSTVYNYDYVISTVFHQEGTIEVTATATGYPQATIFPSHPAAVNAETKFSQRLGQFSMGSLHDHLFVWKVDLDILGTSNSLIRTEIKQGSFDLPYLFPGAGTPLKYVDRQQVMTENNGLNGPASYRYNPNTPTTFAIVNSAAPNNGKNNLNVMRGYSIYIPGTIAQLNNASAPWMPAVEWSLNNVVVTQRKENEVFVSYPMYDMQAPAEPIVRFSSYSNGESLAQQDLVAWVTVGNMHLPSAEDAPMTNTPGTTVSFLLRPSNYFDISPSVDLSDYFYKSANPLPGGPDPKVVDRDFLAPSGKRCSDPVDPPPFDGPPKAA